MKIFFSYGHDGNAFVVESLRRDVEAAGHTVWIDTAEIKAGEDWRRRLVDGLSESDWVVGFLSRHSVREPGVCLDELGIALHVKGGAIATVLVEPEEAVRPPVSVSHIQWLDMQAWRDRRAHGARAWKAWYRPKRDALLALLADPAARRFAGEIAELDRRLKPVSQHADIGTLVEGFVGREWLRERLETWRLDAGASRIFWLTGAPGAGKSAFAAWIAHYHRSNVIGINLCRYNVDELRDPARVFRTLAFQVSTRLPDYRRLLLDRLRAHGRGGADLPVKSPAAILDWLLLEPLRLSIEGGRRHDRYLIVLDALDETVSDGRSALVEAVAESAPKWPAWIALMVTSRPDPEIQRQLSGLRPFVIAADARENRDDLRGYVHGWMNEGPAHAGGHAETERIVAAAEGNFLYLRKLREAVGSGLLGMSGLQRLPQGLAGLYARWLRRQFPAANVYAAYRPLLQVLIAADHPVPELWLTRIFRWQAPERARMLEGLGTLFEFRDEGVAPFHKSLRDWLRDDRAPGPDFVLDYAEGGRLLLKPLWEHFIGGADGAPDPFCVDELPAQMLRLPRGDMRGMLASTPWTDLWARLDAVADALAARFARESAILWWRMAVALADLAGEAANHGHALRMVGGLLLALGRTRDAGEAYQRSLHVCRSLAAADGAGIESRRGVALSLIRTGNVAAITGDLEGALVARREALSVLRALAAKDRASKQWPREAAVALERIGDTLAAKSDRAGALAAYRKALAARRALAAGRQATVQSRHDLAVGLGKVGDMLVDRGSLDDGLASYRAALDIMRRLSREHPDDLDLRHGAHAAMSRVADVLRKRRRFARALALYRDGLRIVRDLGARDPGNARWQRDVAVGLIKIGEVSEDRRDRAGAQHAYRESLGILRTLCAADEDNAEWQLDLVSVLWRLAVAGDNPRARWGEALAILNRLKSQNRLPQIHLGLIAAIEGKLARTEPTGAEAV